MRRFRVSTPATAPGPRRRWQGAATTAVLVSLPLAAVVLYVKYRVVRDSGWASPARGGLSPSTSFFLADAFEALGFTPLALTLLFGWLPARGRVLVMAMATGLLSAIVVAGWLTFQGAGAWPSLGLAGDFISALRTDAGLVDPSAYLPRTALMRAGILVALGATPLLLSFDRIGRPLLGSAMARRGAVLAAPLLVGGVLARLDAESQAGLRAGTMSRLFAGLASTPATPVPASLGPESDPAVQWSAAAFPDPALANAPGPPTPARERSCRSAILVILETASERDYSWDSLRAAMPRNRWYLDHAVVATRHFASHPVSNRSDFSTLSGIYDLTDDRPIQTWLRRAHAPRAFAPGIAATLRSAGYDLEYYFPSRFTIPDDDWAISYLGFDHVESATHRFARVLDKELRAANEVEIFGRAVETLRTRDSDRPFFMVFRTVIGHDPVFSPRTGKSLLPEDTVGRGRTYRDVVGFVDSLLHNVVVAASRHEDSTRIAVAIVSDHGIRNSRDPDFAREPLPLASYRVPAVVSCPALFDGPVFTTHPTSHVDIAPTLGWVLGLEPLRGPSHGLVMTDPRLGQRYTFLFAAKSGVDALLHGDTLTAINRVYGPPSRYLLDSTATRTRAIELAPAAAREAEARFAAVRRAQYRLIAYLSRARD